MKQEFDSPSCNSYIILYTILSASFCTEYKCLLPLSIVANFKRILGHNIFVNIILVLHC